MIRPLLLCTFFFFNDPATTEIYTLSLHDALPIFLKSRGTLRPASGAVPPLRPSKQQLQCQSAGFSSSRSEEHTSELQSRPHLVCRLLLEKKKKKIQSLLISYARLVLTP